MNSNIVILKNTQKVFSQYSCTVCFIYDHKCFKLICQIKYFFLTEVTTHGIDTFYGNDPPFCRMFGEFFSKIICIIMSKSHNPLTQKLCRHDSTCMICFIHKKHVAFSYKRFYERHIGKKTASNHKSLFKTVLLCHGHFKNAVYRMISIDQHTGF